MKGEEEDRSKGKEKEGKNYRAKNSIFQRFASGLIGRICIQAISRGDFLDTICYSLEKKIDVFVKVMIFFFFFFSPFDLEGIKLEFARVVRFY